MSVGRIASVFHTVLGVVVGLLFVLQPAARLSNPNFAYAKKLWETFGASDIGAMRVWGAVFFLFALVVALTFSHPRLRWVYSPLVATYTTFGISLLVAAHENPLLSYTGGVFTLGLAVSGYLTSLVVENDGARRPRDQHPGGRR